MTRTTVTHTYGDGTTETLTRLIADEGKVLTADNETFWHCVETKTPEAYTEIDDPEIEATVDDYITELNRLGGGYQ